MFWQSKHSDSLLVAGIVWRDPLLVNQEPLNLCPRSNIGSANYSKTLRANSLHPHKSQTVLQNHFFEFQQRIVFLSATFRSQIFLAFYAFYAGNGGLQNISKYACPIGRTTQKHPNFWRHWLANYGRRSVLIPFMSCVMQDGLGLVRNSKPTLVQWLWNCSKPRNLAHTLDPNSGAFEDDGFPWVFPSGELLDAAGLYEWMCKKYRSCFIITVSSYVCHVSATFWIFLPFSTPAE